MPQQPGPSTTFIAVIICFVLAICLLVTTVAYYKTNQAAIDHAGHIKMVEDHLKETEKVLKQCRCQPIGCEPVSK